MLGRRNGGIERGLITIIVVDDDGTADRGVDS